eukprot:TRINITY_DN14129_c0_g1_i1.p1 TRINITY_DN14129_c0_g1~~TRINITY_DN14129_c0_g1_i1.p1  ORF type:complete len:1308 (-),score=187.67 TRINITY_DN14129_c0_g1_i1:465-4388(-)
MTPASGSGHPFAGRSSSSGSAKPPQVVRQTMYDYLVCSGWIVIICVLSLLLNIYLFYSSHSELESSRHLLTETTDQVARLGLSHHRTSITAAKESFYHASRLHAFNNVVSVRARFQSFRYEMPWVAVPATFQLGLEKASSAQASALILENGLILTASYIAADGYLISVQRQGQGREFVATAVAIAEELGLALLKVEDQEFWEGTDDVVKLQEDSELLPLQSPVIVAALPPLGSLTAALQKLEAHVSGYSAEVAGELGRYSSFPIITMTLYPELSSLVSVAPVFGADSEGRLVGYLSKFGSIIPARMIKNFISSFRETGAWPGLGTLGMVVRPMTPAALRSFWGLPSDDIGVQIRSVAPDSPFAARGIRKDDMLVAVDGLPIHASGEVNLSLPQDMPIPFQAVLATKMPNTNTTFDFMRPARVNADEESAGSGYALGERFSITVALGKMHPLMQRLIDRKPMAQPSYFMIGGLVFSVLTEDLINQNLVTKDLFVPPATIAEGVLRWRTKEKEDIVILLRSLEHRCNKFYSSVGAVRVVKFFNDRPVQNLDTLLADIGSALSHGAKNLRFAFDPLYKDDARGGVGDPDVVLDTSTCAGADLAVMDAFAVPAPASANLLKSYIHSMPKSFVTGKPQKLESVPVQPHNNSKKDASSASSETPKTEKGKQVQKKSTPVVVESEKDAASALLPWANVVQISLVAADQSFTKPWAVQAEMRARCSAIVAHVAARRILTNSHCVSGAKALYVRREEFSEFVPARVVEIARDVDLAWITTDTDEFWESEKMWPVVNMKSGLVPFLSSRVRVIGYPMGGDSITITDGIVSRIDGMIYPNGLIETAWNTPTELMVIQVDAAINHGNSGGPVFDSNGNLVGLAFAGLDGAQNVGYVIPNVYLQNLVDAVEKHNRWVAQPEVGAIFTSIENEGLRSYWHLNQDEHGVQVRSVAPYSPLYKYVNKGDILVSVDDQRVTGDGKVPWDVDGRPVMLPFGVRVTTKKVGSLTKMDFLRVNVTTGEKTTISVNEAFGPIPPRVARFDDSPKGIEGREFFAAEPTYFVTYGFLWSVMSNPLMQQMPTDAPWSLQSLAYKRWREDNASQLIVLTNIFPHRCNLHYDLSVRALDTVNGKDVRNMEELVKHVLEIEQSGETYLRFTFRSFSGKDEGGNATDPDVVLNTKDCATADTELMQALNVRSRVSPNLEKAFEDAGGVVPDAFNQQPSPASLLELSASSFSAAQDEASVSDGVLRRLAPKSFLQSRGKLMRLAPAAPSSAAKAQRLPQFNLEEEDPVVFTSELQRIRAETLSHARQQSLIAGANL